MIAMFQAGVAPLLPKRKLLATAVGMSLEFGGRMLAAVMSLMLCRAEMLLPEGIRNNRAVQAC
jgi:hypothetical protein